MRANMDLTHGTLFSQNVLLGLVAAGIDRDRAYRIVQSCARRAYAEDRHLRDVLLETDEISKSLDADGIDELFDLDRMLRRLDPVFERLEELKK